MQDAERKLCREASVSQRGMKIPHIEPGSATRVPDGRFAAAIYSFSFVKRSDVAAAQQYPRRQTRCVTRVRFCARPHRVVSLNRKGETHGSRKTRHKAPCPPQEVPQEDQRLFPHKEQAVPIGTGSGESSGSLCVSRSPR